MSAFGARFQIIDLMEGKSTFTHSPITKFAGALRAARAPGRAWLEIVPPGQRTPEYLAKLLPKEIER
jgi:hypothetical protein